jgi:hypothetical protein
VLPTGTANLILVVINLWLLNATRECQDPCRPGNAGRMRNFKARYVAPAAIACGLSAWAITASAWAQDSDETTARELFDRGRRLAAADNYDAACQVFEAARKLYASAGVLLNLADCYEMTGRTASAWKTFEEVVDVAARTNRMGEAGEARRRLTSLEPRLSRLSIRVAGEQLDLTVKRDGVALPTSAWNEAIPVDPGTHELRAEKPGYEPWILSLTLSAQDSLKIVDVPDLRRTEASVAATALTPSVIPALQAAPTVLGAPSDAASAPGLRGQPVLGLIAGGVGVAGVAVGSVSGLIAVFDWKSARANCGKGCGPASFPQTEKSDGQRAATISDVAFAAGGALLTTGLVLFFTAPREPSADAAAFRAPALTWGPTGVTLWGRF